MRKYHLILIATGLALVGCNRTSEREARFLKDRQAIVETVRSCFQQPYNGLNLWMPQDVPRNLDFPGEDHILSYAHSRAGWYGDDQWEVYYRPADTNEAGRNIEVDKLMQFYFSKLEAAGFTSGQIGIGVSTTDTMHTAAKSWSNADRSLLVTAYVVSDRRSGETILTTFVGETLK